MCFARPSGRHGLRLPRPACGRAVRGNSRIAEPQLVWRESWFSPAWVDRRGLVDFGDGFSHEQALADELCEAQHPHFDAVHACCKAQEQISDHRGEDLQADGGLVSTEKRADIEMLLA